jgi:STE24 endopeptidase
MTFFAVVVIFSSLIHLPFEWYDHFIIEEKFGFNKMTVKTFVSDKVKGLILGALIGLPLLWCFLLLTERLGPAFWIWFGVIASIFVLLINLFYTSLLLPLFNKLTPLQNGELKSAIIEYSKKVDFPVDNIFVMDGSKRSGKANAFFSGFGKRKKIVLFDTLIEKHSVGELVAILAHETGHYKKKHIIIGFLTSVIQIFFMLWALSLFMNRQELSLALGGKFNAIHLNLVSFGILFSPVSGIAGLASMIFSRIHEFQADAYAKATSSATDLASGLKKLSIDTLSNLTPHPLYVFFNYSHPPVLNRIRRLSEDI